MEKTLIQDKLLCHICGKMFSYMETIKRHLESHKNTYNCPKCKFTSLRKDAIKRNSNKYKRTECRSLTANNYNQVQPNNQNQPRKSRIETKPSNINSYVYQQSLPKNKEIFPWILHELNTQPRRLSRPYSLQELITIPHDADTHENLTDPRINIDPMGISRELDHILHQEYETAASLSELDMMLRQMESEDAPLPNTEEETNACTVIDSMGTIVNDFN